MSGERRVGSKITLNGRSSRDPDGDPLGIDWTLVDKPPASQLGGEDLLQPVPALATFIPDASGAYLVRLTLNDGEVQASASAFVLISEGGIPPPGGNGGRTELVCPSVGALRGGEEIRFFGGPFPEGTLVRFGQVLATEVRITDGGAVLVATSPKVEAPGVVDVTIEISGDQAILLREGFTFIEGEIKFPRNLSRDIEVERSPTALVSVGPGRILSGLSRGRVQLLSLEPDGSVAKSGLLQLTDEGHPITNLSASSARADGSVDIVVVGGAGAKVLVVRFLSGGGLLSFPLPFEGEAVSAVAQDFERGGVAEVAVADRAHQRLVLYHSVATGTGERYLPFGEYPLGGQPCAVTAGQLDGDEELEIVVGSLPGPEITIIDPGPSGTRVVDVDSPETDGVLTLRAGEFGLAGRSSLAAIARDRGGKTALVFLDFVPAFAKVAGVTGPSVNLDPLTRFEVEDDGASLEAVDLDLDGDTDVALHDSSSGSVRILRNTRNGEPETPEECARVLATGSRGDVPRFRELIVPVFDRPSIQALTLGDWNGDSLPDLAVSHAEEFRGLRILTQGTGE